jgi:glycosyltransferase involved in cell wall biosynthesis
MRPRLRPADFGVNVVGYVTAPQGLGVAARATVSALVQAGVPVAVADVKLPDGRAGQDQTWAHLAISSTDALPYAVTIVHLNPFEAGAMKQQFAQWFTKGAAAVVPFFELPEFPTAWLAPLTQFDAVLAPTEHIAAAVRNEVATPVLRYPLAPSFAEGTRADRARFGIPADAFAFAATLDSDSGLNRKNGVGLIRAFAELVRRHPRAVLVIKANGLSRHAAFERALTTIPPQNLVLLRDYLGYADVMALYASCDAFVSLHRAEGLGLGLLEAMLLGKPVVATGWSGNMDFMDRSCSALVNYAFTPVIDTAGAYWPQNFRRTQLWAEPDLVHAIELMHRLIDDAAWRAELGAAAHARARAYQAAFTPAALSCVEQLYALARERR